MASLKDQKRDILDSIFTEAGIRKGERWRTEAEDYMVGILLNLPMYLPAHQLKQVGELLKWHAVHVKGESRTSLAVMLDESAEGHL